MAIPTNIHTLLSGNVVEWARIEFKTTWDPEASLKTITAFANDIDNWGGGYIVIGVAEQNGRPVKPYAGVPLESIDTWQKDIYEKCKLIRPAYTPIIGKDELNGQAFLIIWCPGGDSRPYSSRMTARMDMFVGGSSATGHGAVSRQLARTRLTRKRSVSGRPTTSTNEPVRGRGRFDISTRTQDALFVLSIRIELSHAAITRPKARRRPDDGSLWGR